MASRPIKDYDHVRIVDNGIFHGYNAIVLSADDGVSARVQLRKGEQTICFWILEKHLLIRHDPRQFIIDGRYDSDAAEKHRIAEAKNAYAERQLEDDDDDYEGSDDMFRDMDIDDVKALYFKCERQQDEIEHLKKTIKMLQGVS